MKQTMVKATFRESNGAFRVVTWHRGPNYSAIEHKKISDLMHDWHAVKCDIIDFDQKDKLQHGRANNEVAARA